MLIQTFLLTVAVMYLLSVYIFLRFDDRSIPTPDFPFYGQELRYTFLSSFYFGLTQGGGVGDALYNISINDDS